MMKITLDENAVMPVRAHETDAGFDLCSLEEGTLYPNCSVTFNTGVHMQIPKGYAGLLVSKSGLNIHQNITSTGLIDSGYTGPIIVKLYNQGTGIVNISKGQKISQIVIIPINTPELELVEKIEDTDRGNNGFGSTGK